MGASKRGNKSGHQYQHQSGAHDNPKRRNTLHTAVPAPAQPAAPWAPAAPNFPFLQPAFLPFYSPLWQYAHLNSLNGLNGLNDQLLLQQSLAPLSAPLFPTWPYTNLQGGPSISRPHSPARGGRRRGRSPDSQPDRGHGPHNKPNPGKGRLASVTPRDDRRAATMPAKDLDLPHASSSSARPPLRHNASALSHQSSSVPSTPRQHVRNLSLTSRSPSPSRSANHSPRSAYSESTSMAWQRLPLRCPFETALTKSRRRMPYSIGDEKLDKAKAPVKKALRAEDEKKLSGDMRELYDRLLPSPESEERRSKFASKLEKLLNLDWPGSNIRVRLFGSSGNMLCTSESDVDICIETPKKELERVCLLATALAKHGMQEVVCVSSAKVPIVKFWDPELKLHCDMNVNNTLALENTRMIKTYVEIDDRVRPLAMIVKHWTKKRILNDAAFGGTLSSYTWICLIIHFLQTRDPPILPALHQRPHQKRPAGKGVQSSFADDMESLQDFGKANKESLGELLFHFFRYFAHELDYEKNVISVRQGKLLSKEEKGWHLLQNNRLGVEEPFNIQRNLGNTADDTSFRGLHIELRRAFTLIAEDVNLGSCCEQYIFPPEEERVWEKPAPQPRPVLSRSTSQPGRGGRGGQGSSRGGRQQNAHTQRGGNANRRASSGTTQPPPPLNFTPPHLAINPQDQYRQTQQAHQLQDQLYQSYQRLQAQEHELRLKLLQNPTGSQGQAGSNDRARGSDQYGSYTNRQSSSRHRSGVETPPLTASLRPEMFVYPYQYKPQHYFQQGTNTDPSSPAMSPSVPELRRSVHRAQDAEGQGHTSIRSQSQPARAVPTPMSLQAWAAANPGMNGLSGLQIMAQGQPYPYQGLSNGAAGAMVGANGTLQPNGISDEGGGVSKEYLNYYNAVAAQQLYAQDPQFRPLPIFGDQAARRQASSPERSPQPPLGSRSPSPLQRSQTFPVSATPGSSTDNQESGRPHGALEKKATTESRQPLIVNGSTTSTHVEAPTHHQISLSGSTSTSDFTCDTPRSGSDEARTDLAGLGHEAEARQPGLEGSFGAHVGLGLESLSRETPGSPPSGEPSSSVGRSPVTTPPRQGAQEPRLTFSGEEDDRGREGSPRTPQQGWRRAIPISFGSIPPLDITPGNAKASDEVSNPSLLSPVLETRTPSPAANGRQLESSPRKAKLNGIPSYFEGDEARYQPQNPSVPASPLASERNGTHATGDAPKTPDRGRVNGSTPHQLSEWQQTGPKNKKKAKKGAQAAAANVSKEPLPNDESERKGG